MKKTLRLKRIVRNAVIRIRHNIWRFSHNGKSANRKTSGQVSVRRSVNRRASRRRAAKRRIIYIAAGSLAVVIATIVLLLTLPAGGYEAAAVAGAGINLPPDEAQTPKNATLMMPVFAPVSITQGMSASVVTNIQIRLMELGYTDKDEPDGEFGETTVEAVKHFQAQHGLTSEEGTVDQQTLDLLFSPEAQEYTITIGAEDTDVSEIQQRLCELDYMSDTTGYFGEKTEAAVKKFQKRNGLDDDGKVDKDTRELLYAEDVVANSFSYGEESPEILDYQKRLKRLGYLTSEPDGKFGRDTKAAVKRFQEISGLIPDGYIGPKTKAALLSSDAQSFGLSLGVRGDDVSKVQELLKGLGYMKQVTGYFGSITDTAVRSFQHNNKLAVDGKVGPKTKSALLSPNAKKSTGVNITGANVKSLIAAAKSKLGCKYVRGGKGSKTFDCSGFVYWCINKIGIKQGYMTSRTWARCTKFTKITKMSKLKRGDIIVYDGHVTICEGNGYQIEASYNKGKIVERKYTTSSYCKSNFICGFRIF